MSMAVAKHSVMARSAVALLNTLALLFFLAASAPHRVHHFFDEHRAQQQAHHSASHDHAEPHHRGDPDAPRPAPATSADCAVLTITQHCQGMTANAPLITLADLNTQHLNVSQAPAFALVILSPRSQRAPPRA